MIDDPAGNIYVCHLLPNIEIPETKFTGVDICTQCGFKRAQCICKSIGTSAEQYPFENLPKFSWKCEFPRQGCTCGKHCNHCGGLISIANPKGFCNHVYYPDNCDVCKKEKEKNQKKEKIYTVYETYPDGLMVVHNSFRSRDAAEDMCNTMNDKGSYNDWGYTERELI